MAKNRGKKGSGIRWVYRISSLVAAILIILYVLAPIRPLAFHPPTAPPLTGVLAPNETLRTAEVFTFDDLVGPEDVAIDDQGRFYGGMEDGRIVRLTAENPTEVRREIFADTDGRPLGLHFDQAGNLIVADGYKGLLSVDTEGEITLLTQEAEGLPFAFTDDLDIARDGRIYFSDASSRYGPKEYLFDLLEALPHGRLLRYDPASQTTEVLLRDLYFANGIALSQEEDFVLVNETYRYRILRYWLKGPKAGQQEVFMENLPGFPDGVSSNRRGTFWIALFTVRNPAVDRLHRIPPAKRILSSLPRFLWPKAAPYGMVLAVDENGRIVRTLQDPGGIRVPQVTSAEESGEFLYLGNLDRRELVRWKLDPAARSGSASAGPS